MALRWAVIVVLVASLTQLGSPNDIGDHECPVGQVPCFDRHGCVSKTALCDGQVQCTDKSDEMLCTSRKDNVAHCSDDYFVCWNKEECVPRKHLCDGVQDCSDGSDEDICEPHERCKMEGLFLCGNQKQCLSQGRLCDNNTDCFDGTDENGQCEARTDCALNKCHHICDVSPSGAKCRCRSGYHMLQNHTCTDINECESDSKEPPVCSHECHNFPGGYNCSCYHGYTLKDDGKCLVKGPLPILLLANYEEIMGHEMLPNRSISAHEESPHCYVKDHDKITTMALGPNHVLYYSDISHKKIYSTHLNGNWKAQEQEVINVGLVSPVGLDVDWITGHLYIADSGRGEILACQGNGDLCTAVITHIGCLSTLVLDQKNRHIYWSCNGETSSIERADLDGRSQKRFVKDHVGHVTALTVDHTISRLYWVDSLFHVINSIHLDGKDRSIFLTDDHLIGSVSMAVLEDRIYWSTKDKGLFSANKFTGRDVQQQLPEMRGIVSLIMMHPALQSMKLGNPCAGANCSNMCLPSEQGHRCICPQDKHLDANNLNCQISLHVPRAFFGAKEEIQQFPLLSVGYQDNLIGTVISENVQNIPAIDISYKHQALVYSDIRRDVIARINVSETKGFSSEEIIFSKELHSVEKLLVDPVTGNIFWVDVGKKTVEVSSFDGVYHKMISPKQMMQRLTSLAIDFKSGTMYLSLVGVSPSILRCALDGTSCLPLSVEVHHPSDLVLYKGRLFIADSSQSMVQIISVKVPNGGYTKVHWGGYDRQLTRMAIYDDKVYWTESKETSLFSIDLSRSLEVTTVLHDIIPLSSIAIWNPEMKVEESACSVDNGGCSHLCLPVSQNSRVCVCNDGFLLQRDNTSCIECVKLDCFCEIHGNCTRNHASECNGLVCDVDQCVSRDEICDGVPDCADMADEEQSRCNPGESVGCRDGSFECDSGDCIFEDLVCNGRADCSDASDEGQQCGTACKDHHCQHDCIPLPQGGVCRCHQGYNIQNDGSCQDVNECETDNGGCSQVCVNSVGDRQCSCLPDFTPHNTSCIPPDPLPYLMFLKHSSLTRYDLDSHGEAVPITALESIIDFDMDMSKGDIFGISASSPKLLLRTNQSHQKPEVLLSRPASRFVFVAYDWLGRNVYLSDISTPALIVCPLQHLEDGCFSLLHEKTANVVLHPVKGLMFWLGDDCIQRSTMSGSKRRSVVEFDVDLPSSLILDQFSGSLYWIDFNRGVIESCDMNGDHRRTILRHGIYMKFLSIEVFGDYLYFTEEKTQSLYRYNRLTGSRDKLVKDITFSVQLRIIHPILQNPGARLHVCAKRQCSHLCLLTPEGAVCACPDGWDLIDHRICKDPRKSATAIPKSTTQMPPKVSPAGVVPWIPLMTNRSQSVPRSTSTQSPPLGTSSAAPDSSCNFLCMNGGTCTYSQEQNREYCICQTGYTGMYCNTEEPLENSAPRAQRNATTVIVGVTLGFLFLVILIIGIFGYMKYKREKVQYATDIVHFQPLLRRQHDEDSVDLIRDFPSRAKSQHKDVDQQNKHSSSYDEPELGGLSWHYSTTSVDSAFVSHTDENDNLTSQLIPTSQRA
ncbi:prolow-density lipoprotein receptor-related protein 1-like isoform X2 [Crassostrea virginica]